MSNFSQKLQHPSGNTLTAIGLLDARVTILLNRGQAHGLKPEAVVITAGLLFVAIVGWINFKATAGLNFEYVYLIVCSTVGWIAGARGPVCAARLHAEADKPSLGGKISSDLRSPNELVDVRDVVIAWADQ